MSNEVDNEEESLLDRFLLFRLGEKIYGAPLLSIKEVIKLQNIEEVPFTESFFKGVINLRGSLISCIDVRLKFGMEELENEKKFVLVFEDGSFLIGGIVDELVSVIKVEDSQIDRNSGLLDRLDSDYFYGVAKVEKKLINLVNIKKLISEESIKLSHIIKQVA